MADFINVERQLPICPTSTQKMSAFEIQLFCSLDLSVSSKIGKVLFFIVRLLIFRTPPLPQPTL
jgi:hypothetical protein